MAKLFLRPMSLRTKMISALLGVALLLFALSSVLVNTLLQRQFREYVQDNQDKRIAEAAQQITEGYNSWGERWDAAAIETIGMNLLGDGLILKVTDTQGNTVWDANVHNGGMCKNIVEHMALNMSSYSPDFHGGYMERTVPLDVQGATRGTLTVGYYGPYFFTDADLHFLSTVNRLLLWAALVCAAAAVALGAFLSASLARPIDRAVDAARRVAGGDYAARMQDTSRTMELGELSEAVNSLAATLERQERLRRQLTSDVAHELRTPLATLQSHLEAMIDGVWVASAERLRGCHEETVRLSALVGDLERLTRAEGDALALQKAPLDLSGMLRRIVTHFEGAALAAGVTIGFAGEELAVCADEDKLRQVFVNLLSNAIKYTPAGGSVQVRAECRGALAVVDVADTGIGISPEDLPNVFERFYRADRSRNRSTGGSGLGLAIARTLVRAHGGDITARSELGRGSVFTVTLPLQSDADAQGDGSCANGTRQPWR